MFRSFLNINTIYHYKTLPLSIAIESGTLRMSLPISVNNFAQKIISKLNIQDMKIQFIAHASQTVGKYYLFSRFFFQIPPLKKILCE